MGKTPHELMREQMDELMGKDRDVNLDEKEEKKARTTTTFARVVFPRVPMEVVSHIVGLWAHVGYY